MFLKKPNKPGTILPKFSRNIGSQEGGYGNQLGLQTKKHRWMDAVILPKYIPKNFKIATQHDSFERGKSPLKYDNLGHPPKN